jgi:recombination protein RecR
MYEDAIYVLIDKLGKLPGVGPKSAQRLAFFLIEQDSTYPYELAEAITAAKDTTRFCAECGNISQNELCQYCSNPKRDNSTILVVEEPKDVVAVEKTREYSGKYHVLGGALNPIQGRGPDDLRIALLLKRLGNADVKEIILANNPNIEGEATAAYLARMLTPYEVKVTKIATGLPMGGDLEYADEMTLTSAILDRREYRL